MADLISLAGIAIAAALSFFLMLWILARRRVVPTNLVQIVQSSSRRVSYGGSKDARNTYYAWPSWMPLIGVTITTLPVNVFQLSLNNYDAYDVDRVPFVLDLAAFFRIDQPNMAAERVSNFTALQQQLDTIVKGAARKILANAEINEILGNRSVFGDKFTEEVKEQLREWGCTPVKSIELMDIRDAETSKAISNIMAKKQSLIEMESRVAVANNKQLGAIAEVEANRKVAMQQQDAAEQIGIRTAQKDQQVGLAEQLSQEQVGVREASKTLAINVAQQKATQATQEEAKIAAEKTVAVHTVEEVGRATITKQVQIVLAEQNKQVSIVQAEGQKQMTVTLAEGNLSGAKLAAEGIQVQGLAKAEAEKAMQLAPVQAQITLAKEIGGNQGYQTYLIGIRQIEAGQVVGVEQAKALQKAEIKVIANTGNPSDGIKTVMDLFSPAGGTRLGAMVEAFANTDAGKAVLNGAGNHA